MKKVKLTQGQVALVDDKDYEELNKYKWYAAKVRNTNNFYAVRNSKYIKGKKRTQIRMHMVIMNSPKGMEIDHIDLNPLNNQRLNLRICTPNQNNINRGKLSTNKSGFKGVSWHKRDKHWRAQIGVNGKKIILGGFPTKELAYEAFCIACVKYHGEFANLG